MPFFTLFLLISLHIKLNLNKKMVSEKFDAIKVGKGEDLVTLTRWVIAQQQVSRALKAKMKSYLNFSRTIGST